MNIHTLHSEFHGKLLRKRTPMDLWGSPLENAWAAVALASHTNRDSALLAEISEWLARWWKDTDIRAEHSIAAAGMYATFLKMVYDNKSEYVASKVQERLLDLMSKTEPKFTIFNSPELLYASSSGAAVTKLDERLRVRLHEVVEHEAKSNWGGKLYRFAFFLPVAIEIDHAKEIKSAIENRLRTLEATKLSHDELIVLLWLLAKYGEKMPVVGIDSKLSNQRRDEILNEFSNAQIYFRTEITADTEEVTGTSSFLSCLQLLLIDEALSYCEAGARIDPNELFDAMQLHQKVRDGTQKLFKDGHYPQAVFEAFKIVIILLKEKSGRKDVDGRALVEEVLGFTWDKTKKALTKPPVLAINKMESESHRDEQEGFKWLMVGACVGIRNLPAHEVVAEREPFQTLELLAFASYLSKILDQAQKQS